jgi:predicted amino acid racemase
MTLTGHPALTIDVDKIERNARAVVELCGRHGIAVTGVTKGVCGDPDVAKAMLRGGVVSIGDSRLENTQRLKAAGVRAPFLLLRAPALSAVDEVVESVDASLASEPSVLAALSRAARRRGLVHDVLLMVDLGDLREGILPDDVDAVAADAVRLTGIRIAGLGCNLACFAGVVPSPDNMTLLVEIARRVERRHGLAFQWISGVNSSGLQLIASGRMPSSVNHARIGEAILLGRETIARETWPGTAQDAFVLRAEILELRKKPSLPIGARGQDAFGAHPAFADLGDRMRALLNVGREDVHVEGLRPRDRGLAIVGASSGYLVVDVTEAERGLRVGDELAFDLDYGALLAAMTSAYVKKRVVGPARTSAPGRRSAREAENE